MFLGIGRIIDVNLNRLTEGLRVVEDIVRLGLEHKGLLRNVRALRTRVGKQTRVLRKRVALSRDSKQDLGRGDRFDRTRRESLEDVLLASFKRAEEAARVLEEVLKIEEPKLSVKLKAIRFRLYDLEKRAIETIDRREQS
jgi:thiamine-phosphate pyrophosphorylase